MGSTSGQTREDPGLYLFTLTNHEGLVARICNYGATLTSLKVPGKNGPDDVVLGFDDIKSYQDGHPYFGCIVGRYANRIAHGRFILDGKEYKLETNNGNHHLHGGLRGFDKVIWEAEESGKPGTPALKLCYRSPDGEEGYPGNLSVTVEYSLLPENVLQIIYEATCDRPCPVNLSHHSYFNLAGAGNGDILNHRLTLHADAFTVVDDELIPTGEVRMVAGTPFDFAIQRSIGGRIAGVSGGYDHNFVLRKAPGEFGPVADVYEPSSGRFMKVLSTEPGVQLYTGNFLDGTITGKAGKKYPKHAGFCLETQHFPDSPNQPAFPSSILYPGQVYRQVTVYRFGVIKT